MSSYLNRAKNIAILALRFARVERVTTHEDSTRPETDADHTVMLGLIACDLARHHDLDLNVGVIAEFCFVHDLVETYAGDTQTLTITAAERAAKTDREAAALARLTEEFGESSWVGQRLREYEEQRTPEARYVRVVDKVLPKLTHLLNTCVAARRLTDRAGFLDAHTRQRRSLYATHPDVDYRVHSLLAEAMKASEESWTDAEKAADGEQ